MKLYYAPGACSMAPHIILREAAYKFDLEKVDVPNKKTASGSDYWKVNSRGYVPTLQLDDGRLLTEASVICQYLADQKPETGLAPKFGTFERYQLMESLNFIAAELHKSLGAFFAFKDKMNPEWREAQLGLVGRRFDALEKMLAGKQYLVGDKFSAADAYLFTILNWTHYHNIDVSKWPNIRAYMARIAARPAVRDTMKVEGLIK